MKLRRATMVFFLVGCVFLGMTLFLRAAPWAFQCPSSCGLMCACEGTPWPWDGCCGYCYNGGFWLDCCNNTCGN
ncbi:MAG: hypothetical protein IMZ53_11555 [Thermoplasmata archaeon]|nr:hypothetical protein [Thermoplasmata archaeon]